jgi:hypothetical protein
MKILVTTFFIAVSLQVSAKEEEYKCDFVWKTLSENISIKDRPVLKSLNQKISDEMTALVKLDEKSSSLQVTEFYKDNRKNFIEYRFSCDMVLNCKGSRTNVVDGKKEIEKIEIPRTSQYGSGKIGSRELFKYENLANGFSYDYIVYKNEANQPMGLKVSCRK